MKSDAWLVARGYASESLLAVLLYVLARLHWGVANLKNFALDTANSWTALVEILLGSSLAVWLALFVNVIFTDFGDYLRYRQVSKLYLYGFAVPAFSYFVLDVVLKLTAWSKTNWLAQLACVLLLYGAINLWTLVKNGIDLAGLYGTFKKLSEAERCAFRTGGKNT